MSSTFLPFIGSIFLKTADISLHAALIVVLLLIIRPVIKLVVPARWIYALWLVVIVRLLLPDVPTVPAATLFPVQTALSAVQHVGHASVILPASPTFSAAPVSSARIPWLAMAWLAGTAGLLLHFGVNNFRWWRRLKRAPEVEVPEVLRLLEECREEMGVSRVRLMQLPGTASPAMTGLFQPVIVLPEDFLEQFNEEELRWILLHEMAHMKRWDAPMQFLTQILQAIYWFNPLVWIAFACFRADRELACDAYVLDRQSPQTSHNYGRALIKVAETYPRSLFAPGFLGISEERTNLQERVEKIGRHRRTPLLWATSGLLLCGLLAFVFLTRCGPPPHEATVKLQVFKDLANLPAEMEVIQSATIVTPAIISLGLDKTWAKRLGSGEAALSQGEIMERVSKMLSVTLKPETTDIVCVTVRGEPAQESADIANAIAGNYVRVRGFEANQDTLKIVHQKYDITRQDLERQMQSENERMEKLQKQASLAPASAGNSTVIEQAQTQLQSTSNQYRELVEQMNQDENNITDPVRILAPAY